jgi:hypothetical protein
MKTNSTWLLNTIRVVLTALWYINIVLIVIAFGVLTWKFCTDDFTEFSMEVKSKDQSVISNLTSLTPEIKNITLNNDQNKLKMKLVNNPLSMALAYLIFLVFEGLVMTIIYQLRKFFDTLKQNQPFQYDNIARLKTIALCFALFTIVNIMGDLVVFLIIKVRIKDFEMFQVVYEKSLTASY